MSSTQRLGNGLMVVTKIVPVDEEESEIPMTKVVAVEPQKKTPAQSEKVPEMMRLFVKGQPLPLGIVQIFLGIMTLFLGVLVIITAELVGAIGVCIVGAFFVMSGLLSAAAHRGRTSCLIKGTLAMSIISCVLALASVGYYCWELTNQLHPDQVCTLEGVNRSGYWQCYSSMSQYKAVVNGVKGILLVMAVFQFCVCTSLSVYSTRAIKAASSDSKHEVYNPVILPRSSDIHDSTAALLANCDAPDPQSP